MPGEAIGALIGAGAGLFGQHQQQKQDEKLAQDQREWNERMYGLQNKEWWKRTQDSRDYNLEMWNMQNKYNSPVEQMARLKEAGLNPHLMYGKGTLGQAGQMPNTSIGNAQDVKGYTRAQARNVLAGVNTFGDFVNWKNTQAQTNNVEQATDVAKMKEIREGIAILRDKEGLKGDKFRNYKLEKTLDDSIEAVSLLNKKMKADIHKTSAEGNFLHGTLDARMNQEVNKQLM